MSSRRQPERARGRNDRSRSPTRHNRQPIRSKSPLYFAPDIVAPGGSTKTPVNDHAANNFSPSTSAALDPALALTECLNTLPPVLGLGVPRTCDELKNQSDMVCEETV